MRKVFPFLSDEALRALSLLGNPIHIYCFNTRRICWANEAGLKMWNATSLEELSTRELTPFSPAAETRLEEYRHAFRKGEDRNEGWTLFPKGVATTFRCLARGVSIEGHPEAMLSEVVSLEPVEIPPAELRALEALRHTPLMISLFAQDGKVLMRNPAATACFRDIDRNLPQDADHFAAMFASEADHAAFLDNPVKDVPIRRDAVMALPNSPVHTLHVTPVSDPVTGKIARLVAQEDISDFIAVNRQLAASEDALDAVLTLKLVPVLILSATNSKVLKANHTAQERIGPAVVAGGDARDIFVKPEDYAAVRETMLAGQGGAIQAEIKSADEQNFWASLSGVRIVFEKQDAMVILLTDIDAVYRTAEDLETALSVERTSGEMQRRFLAIASHEFRTPISLIDSVAQRLSRGAETMSPDQIRNRAQRIRATVKRLLQLMETIIDRARDNQMALGYVPAQGDIGDLIERIVADFRESRPGLQIDVNLPPLPPLSLDPALMAQAISNLIINADKYSLGSPHVAITAMVTSEDVQIFIRDWGIGIPADEQARVFSDYVRGSNVGTRPGTGLGLSIVSHIISLHGGMIEVVDQEGPGTTMKITLPRP